MARKPARKSEGPKRDEIHIDDFLDNFPLLRRLGPQALADLRRTASYRTLGPGELLFRQGEIANGMFLILHGAVEIAARIPGDDEVAVSRIGAGDLVGELSMLDGGGRSATARAAEPTGAMFISRARIRNLMSDAGPAAFALMGRVRGQVAARARATYAAIFDRQAFDSTILRRSASRARIAKARQLPVEVAALISGLARLSALTAADARALARSCEAVTAAKGALIADAGDNPDHLHIVLRGALRGALKRRRGGEQIHVHGPGEIVGLVPVIDGFPHPLRIEAAEDSLLLRMTRRDFETMSKGRTDLAIAVFDTVSRQLARDVRRANRHLGRAQGLARFNEAAN